MLGTICLKSCVYKISKDSKCCFNKFDYEKPKYTIVFREFNFSLASVLMYSFMDHILVFKNN